MGTSSFGVVLDHVVVVAVIDCMTLCFLLCGFYAILSLDTNEEVAQVKILKEIFSCHIQESFI
jgi:hypothetical protein